jgi:hypothetical protein
MVGANRFGNIVTDASQMWDALSTVVPGLGSFANAHVSTQRDANSNTSAFTSGGVEIDASQYRYDFFQADVLSFTINEN